MIVETERDAALSAVLRGWPVVPGTYLTQGRWLGRDGSSAGSAAAGLCPVDADWAERAITDWEDAYHEWIQHPYSVLLACGEGTDALELPSELAQERVWPALQTAGLAGPAVILGDDRWVLLTISSTHPGPELGAWPSVTYRGRGHWVALPPTTLATGQARWHRHPDADPALTLPQSVPLRQVVADALHQARV